MSPITKAIVHLAGEHGLPNNFSAGEIALESGHSAMEVGRRLTRRRSAELIASELAARGIQFVGYGRHDDGLSYVGVEVLL